MADPFISEIRVVAFNFAPIGWALCDGQVMPASQNTALYSLIGTTYGGNGQTTFALPNLQGRAAMHPGQGPGLSPHDRGEMDGTDTVTLIQAEIPMHTHLLAASQQDGNERAPADQMLATGIGTSAFHAPDPLTALNPNALAPAGGSQPHNNMQPFLSLYFAIALTGVFPPQP